MSMMIHRAAARQKKVVPKKPQAKSAKAAKPVKKSEE